MIPRKFPGELGIVIGTGPSLTGQADTIRQMKRDGQARLFGINNTFEDFGLDVWIACDEAWHKYHGPITGGFDKWHWDGDICKRLGYRYVQGCWSGGSAGATNQWKTHRDGHALSLDPEWISLNHGSAPQAINLAVLYGCSPILLVGHDFRYGEKRHYFGEYPGPLRKYSQFHKPHGDDLAAVYERMAATPGIPPIVNVTPGTKLTAFPVGDIEDYRLWKTW